ncbi:MAG: hypothetical protein H6816_16080 [Phycisphaerales bacterium]|nr:hypothetical protein [Phycisphaerales bacterium]
MSKTVKVRFLRAYKVKDEEGREFEEGKEYDLTPDSAQHFISRQAAVLMEAGKPKSKAKAGETAAGDSE